MPVEIERKYLLNRLPELPNVLETLEVDQGYMPGVARLRHQRSRSGTERFFRTVKTGSGVERMEQEDEIDRATFARLWPLTEGRRVKKRRHIVPHGDDYWEIDEFLDRDLVLAELELDRADARVTIPDWLKPALVREVTDELEYTNRALAR